MKIRLFSTLPFLAFVLPEAAFADGSSEVDGEAITVLGTVPSTLETPIETGSRLKLDALDTPASVETLAGDVIRARGDLSVVDAVTRATGISSVANPGNGGTALAARGFSDQGSVMILYDGVRLYPGAGTVTFPTDPWMVDRIEVLRGPASVLYGQGAIGGAVNVISRKPTTDRTHLDAEAGFGSQASWRVAAGLGGPIGKSFSYRLDASRTASDGWVDRGHAKGLAVTGSIRFTPTTNFTITLSHDLSDQKPARYFGTPLIDGKLDDRNKRLNYNVADAVIHYRDNRTTLKAQWQIGDDVALTSTAYRLTTHRRWRNLESYRWDGSTGRVNRADYLGIDHDQMQIGNQTTLSISHMLGRLQNDFVAGFDVNSIKFRHSNNFYPGAPSIPDNTVNPFTFDPGQFDTTVPILPAYRTRTHQYSFSGEDRLSLTERLSLVVGINYEHANVKRYTIATNSRDVQSLDKALRNTTWRAGMVYQPSKVLSLYAQYATAVDPLGSLVTFSPSQSQFKNTTGDQVEAGVKAGFLNGRGSFTFAAYRIVKKNLLVRDLNDPTNTTPLQVGQRSSEGVEASLTLDMPQGFGIDANASVLDARFDEFNTGGISYNGKTPPGVPETTANLWFRYDPAPGMRFMAGLRYVGRTFSDNGNSFRVPAYAVIDLGASYAVTEKAAVNLRVYNLFDRDYPVTTYNDQQWLLGRPRAIDVSLSLRL